jgi:hypothetical protein
MLQVYNEQKEVYHWLTNDIIKKELKKSKGKTDTLETTIISNITEGSDFDNEFPLPPPSLLSIFLSMNILNPTHLAMILLMQLLLHLMILLCSSKKNVEDQHWKYFRLGETKMIRKRLY